MEFHYYSIMLFHCYSQLWYCYYYALTYYRDSPYSILHDLRPVFTPASQLDLPRTSSRSSHASPPWNPATRRRRHALAFWWSRCCCAIRSTWIIRSSPAWRSGWWSVEDPKCGCEKDIYLKRTRKIWGFVLCIYYASCIYMYIYQYNIVKAKQKLVVWLVLPLPRGLISLKITRWCLADAQIVAQLSQVASVILVALIFVVTCFQMIYHVLISCGMLWSLVKSN